jgi:hypothetical protein
MKINFFPITFKADLYYEILSKYVTEYIRWSTQIVSGCHRNGIDSYVVSLCLTSGKFSGYQHK